MTRLEAFSCDQHTNLFNVFYLCTALRVSTFILLGFPKDLAKNAYMNTRMNSSFDRNMFSYSAKKLQKK